MTTREIVALMKVSTDIERKARLDQVPAAQTTVDDNNAELRKTEVHSGMLKEVVDILQKTGALNAVGIRTTTEVIIKND
jgi:hypothetical protein